MRRFRKIISNMAVIMSVGLCVYSAEAMTIDDEYARIKEEWRAINPQAPHIVIIEDAHCHYEAQQNIIHILQGLVAANDTPCIVGIEGAACGPLETDRLKLFNDEKRNTLIAEQMLKDGALSAAEFLHLQGGAFTLYGLEDTFLYQHNVMAYADFMAEREVQAEALRKIQKALEKIQTIVLPREYNEFVTQYSQYIEEDDFIFYIIDMARLYDVWSGSGEELAKLHENKQHLLELNEKEILREITLFRKETGEDVTLETPLSALSPQAQDKIAGYYALKKSAFLREALQSIDYEQLNREIVALKQRISYAICREDDERELLYHRTCVAEMSKLLTLKLTPTEYSQLKNSIPPAYAEQLITYIKSYMPDFTVTIHNGRLPTERYSFYELAESRDYVLAHNALALLRNQHTEAGTQLVLVVGGFHSSGLSAVLRQEGVSYTVISPRITGVSKEDEFRYMQGLAYTIDHVSGTQRFFEDAVLAK